MEVKKDEWAGKILVICGGLGFIGKNLLEWIFANEIKFKRVVSIDKIIPEMSNADEELLKLFREKKIENIQVDIGKYEDLQKVLGGLGQIDYLVNLAGETRYGYDEQQYEYNILQTGKNIHQLAKDLGVGKLIEVSTSLIYESKTKERVETSKKKPVDIIAKYRLLSEENLLKTQLKGYTILRVAQAYGKYCKNGLTYRVMGSMIYRYLKENQRLLWSKTRLESIVHVVDVCRAILFCFEKGHNAVFNLSDQTDKQTCTIQKLIDDFYGTQTEYVGSVKSYFIWINIDSVLEELNEKHMIAWNKLCNASALLHQTPQQMVLYKDDVENFEYNISSALILKEGFTHKYPTLNNQVFSEYINQMTQLGWIPDKLKIAQI